MGNFVPGIFDDMKYKAAPNSGFLYALCTGPGRIRVGFQSADAPGVITEAAYSGPPQCQWVAAQLQS